MNLNHVRLLEACLSYLIDKVNPDIKDQLSKSTLVFETNGQLYQFRTSQQQSYHGNFVEYLLGSYQLREVRREISDMYDLYRALDIRDGELLTLKNTGDIALVKSLLFKLLAMANLDDLGSKYPDLKSDTFVYDVTVIGLDKTFSVYQFPADASFRLVSIS